MVFSTYLINVRCSMKFQKGSNWPLTNSDRQDPPNRIKNISGHKPQTIKFYKISKLTLDNDMNDINSELKATMVEPCLIVSYAKLTKFVTKEGDDSIYLRLPPTGFISYICPLLLVWPREKQHILDFLHLVHFDILVSLLVSKILIKNVLLLLFFQDLYF